MGVRHRGIALDHDRPRWGRGREALAAGGETASVARLQLRELAGRPGRRRLGYLIERAEQGLCRLTLIEAGPAASADRAAGADCAVVGAVAADATAAAAGPAVGSHRAGCVSIVAMLPIEDGTFARTGLVVGDQPRRREPRGLQPDVDAFRVGIRIDIGAPAGPDLAEIVRLARSVIRIAGIRHRTARAVNRRRVQAVGPRIERVGGLLHLVVAALRVRGAGHAQAAVPPMVVRGDLEWASV